MIEKVEWHTLQVGDISPPPQDILQSCRIPRPEYIINQTEVGPKRHPSLTREAALLLVYLHPPLVWGRQHQCIGGLRILTLAAPYLQPEDLVPVGILPAQTSQEELITLLEADMLLSQMAFGTQAGAKTIYAGSRHLDPDLLTRWSPALAAGVRASADLLGVSVQTLYNPPSQKSTP